ncbi:ATP-binding protein [Pseudobacteriovorax antillogorgiicola]|uniref:histidine kinase n=1 Tax=Pseudobacteriovorax antillogorgiicola TaxID=1513793 RepID=A0A1Y6BRE3_9BACT|nr:ATP-binding protein [Pseudobacteriovorax antillogorgiicola]TCS54633.1 PAS domain S-box-containing protein [Pseudobacteriovorax antillogorgiicola]SMF17149.1 PAS domain S-box-containing protein [Pseudobacteriovorax antillogorgiicola]
MDHRLVVDLLTMIADGEIKKAKKYCRLKSLPNEISKAIDYISSSTHPKSELQAKIARHVLGQMSTSSAGQAFVNILCETLDVPIACVFVADHAYGNESAHLIPVACVGVASSQELKPIALGQAGLGQACQTQTTICIKTPGQVFAIDTGFSKIYPEFLLAVPMIVDGRLVGGLQLVSLKPFSKAEIDMIENSAIILSHGIRNISSRLREERLIEQLHVSHTQLERQKQALDAAAIVAETDVGGRITYVNDRFLEISGYSRDELLGEDHRIINSGYHPRTFFRKLWQTLAQGKIWKGEICNRSKSGDEYWVDTTIFPFRDEHDKVQRFVAIRFDITARKVAENEVIKASRETQELVKAKAELLANVSHEIRTPLHGILGYTQLLLEANTLDELQSKRIRIVHNCSEQLRSLIDDFLDLSKIQEGQMDVNVCSFDLKNCLDETIAIHQITADHKGLKIINHIGEGTIQISSDPIRVRQIVSNLIGNAIKYTEQGAIDVLLKHVSEEGNRYFDIAIKDSGRGIPEEEQEIIFQRFKQGRQQSNHTASGSGLGLFISKSLAEKLGGNITLHSIEGQGSTFTVRLHDNVSSNTSQTQPLAMPDRALLDQFSVLVVDDIEVNRDLANSLVSRLGPTVHVASSGMEALQLIKSHSYHLILLDLRMPEMDGFETAEGMQEYYKSSPSRPYIVALSANTSESDRTHAAQSGMDNFIAKPLTKRDLAIVFTDLLERVGKKLAS